MFIYAKRNCDTTSCSGVRRVGKFGNTAQAFTTLEKPCESMWCNAFFVPHFVNDNKPLVAFLFSSFLRHWTFKLLSSKMHASCFINYRFVELQFPETNISRLSARTAGVSEAAKKSRNGKFMSSSSLNHRTWATEGVGAINSASYFITNTWESAFLQRPAISCIMNEALLLQISWNVDEMLKTLPFDKPSQCD